MAKYLAAGFVLWLVAAWMLFWAVRHPDALNPPPAHYVVASDGTCLKLSGGGVWRTWHKEVSADRCK